MQTVMRQFENEAQKREFVHEVEAAYAAQIEKILPKLVSAKERIFTLSGPTCSGKTTTAHQMLDAFAAAGKRVAVVSIDDFFLSREDLSERQHCSPDGQLDYDSLAALDFDYFCECADLICTGKEARLPQYDFVTGQRVGYRTLSPDSYDVVLFEGIQAIYPEVTAHLRRFPVCEVAIGVRKDVCVNGICFDKREIRLMRRILRDFRKRAASAEFSLFLWRSVAQNEEKNILPYEDDVTIRIASFLPYEVFVLKKPLCEVLATVPKESAYYAQAQELIAKLAPLPEIAEDYVPKDSLFWEFL